MSAMISTGYPTQVQQLVITTRIYFLHKITIALKFMSYINSDLPIPPREETANTRLATVYHKVDQCGLDWKRVGS